VGQEADLSVIPILTRVTASSKITSTGEERDEGTSVKPAAFEYVRPARLGEAVDALAKATAAGRDAQILAGGQSLLAMMNLRVSSPDLLIDISRLEELRSVTDEGDAIRIGACVTHAAIEDGLASDPSRGLMPKVAAGLAYRAVRTKGTLGGSLALSDPAADWVAVMQAMDATIVLAGPGGRRETSAITFTTGLYETARGRNEIVECIRVPKLSGSARWGYAKFSRKTGAFAISIAAVVADPIRRFARIVLGAAERPPILLQQASQELQDGGGLQSVCEAADRDVAALADGADDYQRSVYGATISRAVSQVLA
jgi:aerobic carbon-monoxide dehydrogenase medium subunit